MALLTRQNRKNRGIMTEETNIGRQIEFDYMKGIFMPFIFLVHAFQATGSDMSPIVSCVYIFATMSGAAIFIFIVGFGSVYDSRVTPSGLAKRGIRMVIYQYLSNLLYVLSLLIPYRFVKNSLSAEGADAFSEMVSIYMQFINIFFITGIIYLFLALLRKIRFPVFAYPILAVLIAVAAPMIYGTPVDIPVIGYITELLIGEAPYVSFTPLYFLSYALIGVTAGHCYRKIKDKGAFYKRMIPVSAAVVLIWWGSVTVRLRLAPEQFGYPADISAFTAVMDYAYSCPDIWHVVASTAHIILFAGLIWFCLEKNKKEEAIRKGHGLISSQILYYSRNISKYYALHLSVYLIVFGFHGYVGFTPGYCLLLMMICVAVTEIMVRLSGKMIKNHA